MSALFIRNAVIYAVCAVLAAAGLGVASDDLEEARGWAGHVLFYASLIYATVAISISTF